MFIAKEKLCCKGFLHQILNTHTVYFLVFFCLFVGLIPRSSSPYTSLCVEQRRLCCDGCRWPSWLTIWLLHQVWSGLTLPFQAVGTVSEPRVWSVWSDWDVAWDSVLLPGRFPPSKFCVLTAVTIPAGILKAWKQRWNLGQVQAQFPKTQTLTWE